MVGDPYMFPPILSVIPKILLWIHFHVIFLKYYIALSYCDSMSHSHSILTIWLQITNKYFRHLYHHLCATWGMLASESNIFLYISIRQFDELCSPWILSDPFNWPPDSICVSLKYFSLFYSCDTFNLEMKVIGNNYSPSRYLSNFHFPHALSYEYAFITST